MSAGTTEAALARYAAGEFSLVELGRVLGTTRREARAALERTGISVRHPGRPSGSSRLAGILTEDYLRREVLGRRRGVAEVAAEVGCTPKTVRRYLRASGIVDLAPTAPILDRAPAAPPPVPFRDGFRPAGVAPGEGEKASGTGLSREALWEAYIVRASSTTAIAAAAGCAPSTVGRDLRRNGITLRRRGGAPPPAVRLGRRRADGFRPAGVAPAEKAAGTGLTREALWEAYIVRASSTTAIAAAAGCAPSTVGRDLRRNGITLRRRGGAPPPAVRLGRRRAGIRRAVQAADS